MKYLLQKVLAVLARLTIRKFKPFVVGVTGSVGKTSAREAIFAVLKTKRRVRQPEKNYNNEIGLPLAILGMPHYGRNVFKWLGSVLKVLSSVCFGTNYPKVLILEYGVDRPGDMDYLLKITKPRIAIITAIGDVPMHVENFKDPEDVVREKSQLIKALSSEGVAILNHDDYVVYDLKDKTKAKLLSYGFEEKADIRAINYELKNSLKENMGEVPDGVSFKVVYKNSVVPMRIKGGFGRPAVYAALAGVAVGISMDMNLVEISEALSAWTTPAGRLRLVKGIKNSFIIDDTYNAGPESVREALDVLKNLPGKRKIAVLGDMLELGRYSEQAHRALGDNVAEFANMLFTLGPRAKFIADEARIKGMEMSTIYSFDDFAELAGNLQNIVAEGDLVLIKGSQGMRMEKIVEEIMDMPELAWNLLVRQEEYWKS